MRTALVNNWLEITGIGNYAFSLGRELQNLIESEHIYLNMSEKAVTEKNLSCINGLIYGPMQIKRFINELIIFPLKFPIKQKFDLYHFASHIISNLALKVKPSIVTCHDASNFVLESDTLPGHYYNQKIKQNMKRLSQIEKIITVSDFSKRELVKHCGFNEDFIAVTPLGFNKQAFQPGDKKMARKKLGLPLDKKIILHVGAEGQRKNVNTIFRALKETNDPDIIFNRVGKRYLGCQKIIKQLGLKNVQYVQDINQQEMVLRYQAADAFVFPSYYEGFGLPPLEAMACGCPVISSNAASLPEVTGKAAIALDPFDASAWAENIAKVLASESLQKKLSARGLEQSRKFSWKKCAQETVKVYNEVLA